jgi:RimJ/RimL family protein N-acetyltransferase
MIVTFSPLAESDFNFIESWLQEPHVQKTWGNEKWEESYEKYLFRISSDSVKQFIIQIDTEPVGYIQYYWASKVGDGWWEGFDENTVGFDLYIGNPNYLGKGYGKIIVNAFLRLLFQDSKICRIIADPSPQNEKIINLLKNVGFVSSGEIQTPDGQALFMELNR